MKPRIGKDLACEYKRNFVPENADLGDPTQVEALYGMLEKEALPDRAELEAWLLKWSELSSVLAEESAVRYIMMTCQTDDPDREKAFLEFLEKIDPIVKNKNFVLSQKLLSAPGVGELSRDRYSVFLREVRNEVEIFREENVALQTEEEKLGQQYQKLIGSLTVQFDGRERTLQQMSKYLELQDRDTRQKAWQTVTGRRLEEREKLDDIFDRMLDLRARIARNAGFDNYRDYAFRQRGRFDYGVAECEGFHLAVEEAVAPLYRERQKKRQSLMKLDALRPWDLAPDPRGLAPLKPFETADELIKGCREIFNRLDPALGKWFSFMADHELLDLSSRKGKAPGAYSHSLMEVRLPFIFANSVGVDGDVNTMLHEAGHAFHTLECRGEDLVFYRHAPTEFAEVASMSMEFLGGDHLDVFYNPDDKARSRERHLESVISLFCWIATVDAFQHWIYTHPGHSAPERADAWRALRDRFGGIENWEGLDEARGYEWHRQLHIFEHPFYYIEYGIAQLGALQVWANSQTDKKTALEKYRAALALGGSRPLPELFAAAGARFDMSKKTIAPLVNTVRAALESGEK